MARLDHPDARRSVRDRLESCQPTVRLRDDDAGASGQAAAATAPSGGTSQTNRISRSRSMGGSEEPAKPGSEQAGVVFTCSTAEGPGVPPRSPGSDTYDERASVASAGEASPIPRVGCALGPPGRRK